MEENLFPVEEMLEISKKRKSFSIGIPREVADDENRIALTPEAVDLFTANGHQVLIEKNAGLDANYLDKDFADCGGKICEHKKDVFHADIILKVAPFSDEEIDMLKKNQIIISMLRLSVQKTEVINKLIQKKVTAIAYEYLQDETNSHPVVRSMSEISGMTSIMIASEYLSNIHGGKGVLLGGIPGITPAEVTILGASTAAEFAARSALGLGAEVKIFDDSICRLRKIQEALNHRVFTSIYHPQILIKTFKSADVVIGAIDLISGGKTFFVQEDLVRMMKPGAVVIDLSIDQGGCFESSSLTNHHKPIFTKHNVIHYCVPNIPSRVARTASIALSNIFTPILLGIGDSGGIKNMLKEDIGLRKGVYVYNGILTNKLIGNKFSIRSQDIDLLMAVF